MSERCVLPGLTASLPVDFVEQNVAWGPAGATLYYIVSTDNGQEVQFVDLASSAPPSTLIPAGTASELWDLRPSPGGEMLAYAASVRGEKGEALRHELRVQFLHEKRARVLLSFAKDRLPLNVSGWSRSEAVIVHRRVLRPGRLFEMELMEVPLEGAGKVLSSVADSAVPVIRIDAARGRSFVTRSVDGIHNIFVLSLRDGVQRQVTANRAPGVSFSGIQPLQDDAIVFAREERKRDIWLLTSGSRRQ